MSLWFDMIGVKKDRIDDLSKNLQSTRNTAPLFCYLLANFMSLIRFGIQSIAIKYFGIDIVIEF